jgi:hypothetical protein
VDRYQAFQVTFSFTLRMMTATTGPLGPVRAEGNTSAGAFSGVLRRGKESRWSDERPGLCITRFVGSDCLRLFDFVR